MRPVILASFTLALMASTTAAEARAHHHHHYRHHAHHVHKYRNMAEGLGAGLAHMLGSIQKVQTEAGPIKVASAYADRFVGFINALVESGYKPHEIGCYSATGHMPGSKHHSGMACDIDQRSRNVTARRMYHITELAHRFHLTDGCEWRNRDCGHVEVPGATHYAHHRRYHVHYARAE